MGSDLRGAVGRRDIGIGYALWYSVLPSLTVAHAASEHLSVPMIATLAGALLLHEAIMLVVAEMRREGV